MSSKRRHVARPQAAAPKPVVPTGPRRDREERRIVTEWERRCDELITVLGRFRELGPEVEIQSTHADGVGIASGLASSGHGQLDYSDQVLRLIQAREQQGWPMMVEEQLRAVVSTAKAAIRDVTRALRAPYDDLARSAPAAARAVAMGRPAWSGRDQAEVKAEEEHGRVIHDEPCQVCGVLDDGRLGMCVRHEWRWRRCPDYDEGRGDRGHWVAHKRHRWLVDELVGSGFYGEGIVRLPLSELERGYVSMQDGRHWRPDYRLALEEKT